MSKKIVALLTCFSIAIPCSRAQTTGRVELRTFFSTTLGVTKNYYVYLPNGYDLNTRRRYPVVYFLRLHEYECFNPMLPGRDGTTLKDVADTLMANGHIGEMILICPSTGSNDSVVSGAVNMLYPNLVPRPGIGTGNFEDYLRYDLISHIDSTFRTIPDQAHRGVDGFSLGGYSAIVLSFLNPHIFSSVASYDGSIMWHNLDDPEIPGDGPDDPLWLNPQYDLLFGPLFGIPRDIDYMLLHNATHILETIDPVKLDSIRSMRFHIHAGGPTVSNLPRNLQLLEFMAAKGLSNTFPDVVLAPDAVHDYGFADLHASQSLVKHWETFQEGTSTDIDEEPTDRPVVAELQQNYPNPVRSVTTIPYVLSEAEEVTLEVLNVLGQRVALLVDSPVRAGQHAALFDGTGLPGGVYLYRLTAGTYSKTKRLALFK